MSSQQRPAAIAHLTLDELELADARRTTYAVLLSTPRYFTVMVKLAAAVVARGSFPVPVTITV